MKNDLLLEALDYIDPDLLDGAYLTLAESAAKKSRKTRRRVFYSAGIAAAAALVAIVIPFGIRLFWTGETGPVESIYTAEQIGALFDNAAPGNSSEGESAESVAGLFDNGFQEGHKEYGYVAISAPSINELKYYYLPLQTGNTIKLYAIGKPSYPVSEEGMWKIYYRYYDRVCEAFGVEKVEELIDEPRQKKNYSVLCIDHGSPVESMYSGGVTYRVDGTGDFYYHVVFQQSESYERFAFSNYEIYNPETFVNGMKITVDQTEDDETIKASLEPIRKALCELFEVDLPDIFIYRLYDSYSQNGCAWLDVCFYNAEQNGVDFSINKCSDYIQLPFDNFSNYSGDIVSDKELTIVSIEYIHYRGTPEEYCQVKDTVEMISIEEAEKLLCKGYVFGSEHICPLCMEKQDRIVFEDYDFVGLLYYKGYPFYAFFKEIGPCRNGDTMFARALVPAFKVTGYEEYFEAQKEFHPNWKPQE